MWVLLYPSGISYWKEKEDEEEARWEMKPKSIVKQLTRHYIIEEKILMNALDLEGKEIIDMSLYEGLSPNDEAKGKSHTKCKWSIYTKDVTGEKPSQRTGQGGSQCNKD